MNAVVTAVVGGLLLLVIGWQTTMVTRLGDKIDRLEERMSARFDHVEERITALAERVSRIEGRLDEREHNRP
jgi:hypothetical protein